MSEVRVGSVVQLDPEVHTHHNGFWAGNFMLVTEVKSWGVQGFCKTEGGNAYFRAENGTFEYVGEAEWVPKPDEDE